MYIVPRDLFIICLFIYYLLYLFIIQFLLFFSFYPSLIILSNYFCAAACRLSMRAASVLCPTASQYEQCVRPVVSGFLPLLPYENNTLPALASYETYVSILRSCSHSNASHRLHINIIFTFTFTFISHIHIVGT